MNLETAFEAKVSRDEAFAELKRHGICADYDGAELFDCQSGETIAIADKNGDYAGADILTWIGY